MCEPDEASGWDGRKIAEGQREGGEVEAAVYMADPGRSAVLGRVGLVFGPVGVLPRNEVVERQKGRGGQREGRGREGGRERMNKVDRAEEGETWVRTYVYFLCTHYQ